MIVDEEHKGSSKLDVSPGEGVTGKSCIWALTVVLMWGHSSGQSCTLRECKECEEQYSKFESNQNEWHSEPIQAQRRKYSIRSGTSQPSPDQILTGRSPTAIPASAQPPPRLRETALQDPDLLPLPEGLLPLLLEGRRRGRHQPRAVLTGGIGGGGEELLCSLKSRIDNHTLWQRRAEGQGTSPDLGVTKRVVINAIVSECLV